MQAYKELSLFLFNKNTIVRGTTQEVEYFDMQGSHLVLFLLVMNIKNLAQ